MLRICGLIDTYGRRIRVFSTIKPREHILTRLRQKHHDVDDENKAKSSHSEQSISGHALTIRKLRSTAVCSAIPSLRSSRNAATSKKIASAVSTLSDRRERIRRMIAVSGISDQLLLASRSRILWMLPLRTYC